MFCAAEAKLVTGFEEAHVLDVLPYEADAVVGGCCDNPLMAWVDE